MMAFAASSDLLTMTIANRVSLILVGGFVVLAYADRHERRRNAVACRCRPPRCSRCVFVFFAFGWIGGGDAKLAAATVLWLGFAPSRRLSALCFVARRRADGPDHSVSRLAAAEAFIGREWAERLHRRDGGVPYGIALAAAALLVYPHTEWMKAALF